MGYESRIFLVQVHRDSTYRPEGLFYAEKIADIRMGKVVCGSPKLFTSFPELFKKEIDYKLYVDSRDETTAEDRYGDHMKSCSVEKVIEWLEKAIENDSDPWWRLPMLLGLLKGIGPHESIEVVHYGY